MKAGALAKCFLEPFVGGLTLQGHFSEGGVVGWELVVGQSRPLPILPFLTTFCFFVVKIFTNHTECVCYSQGAGLILVINACSQSTDFYQGEGWR